EAKYCLTATAERENMRLITVVMGAESVQERSTAVTTLLNYGFNQYETEEIFHKNEVVDKINLLKGKPETVNIITKNNIKILKYKSEPTKDIQTNIVLNDNLKIPIRAGSKVGTIFINENDQTKSIHELTIDQNVERANIIDLTERILKKMTFLR